LEFTAKALPRYEDALAKAITASGKQPTEFLRNINVWRERVRHHLLRVQRDLELLFPWLPLLEAPGAGCEDLARELKQMLCEPVSPEMIVDRCSLARSTIAQASHAEQTGAGAWLRDLERCMKS
jgi:GAF domain-containing protein